MQTDGVAEASWGRRAGLGELVRNALAARSAPAVIIVVTVLFSLPSLLLGFSVDEYFQRVALSHNAELAGMERAPWDLFTFASREVDALLMEEGIFPWWTDRELVISFFRPLTSLTLYADHVLWPDNVALFHLHNVFWYALLLGSVWMVYREFRVTARLPALAFLLYALDDARGQVVGWIALRNASIALIPAFLALVFHHRYRRGWGKGYGVLAPLCLALGLLGGEVAVAVCGYLVAYAVFMERGSFGQRVRSLLPYLALLLPYRLLYNAHGFGALHSGLYVDPAREPLAFFYCIVSHLPLLLFGQFALLPAELWEPAAMIAPWLQPMLYCIVIVGLSVIAKLLWPILQRAAEARFWALGSALATLPVCGTLPQDRLLIATSLGGAALLSYLILALFDSHADARASTLVGSHADTRASTLRATRIRRGVGYALVFMHCVFAPLFFSVRARDLAMTERILNAADRSVSRKPELAQKTLIMVNPVLSALGTYFPVYRAVKGGPLPAGFRYLASAESALTVERVDAHTLGMRAEGGFLFSVTQRAFRSAFRTFRVGEQIALSDMTVTVTELMPDGTPAAVLARFEKTLEDPSLEWLQWGTRAYVPFTPPKLGERVVLPKVDSFRLIFAEPDPEG
jgi:hypothetical protein